MLDSFKRLFSRRVPAPATATGHDLDGIAAWARQSGHAFKRVRDARGFVIEGGSDGRPWRIEWGLPQRGYIVGHELRMRMALDLPDDAQMLVLARPLMDTLERQTFDEFTDSVQTQASTRAPEEMRWLVMFPKVDLSALKTLRMRFGAVASVPAIGLAWLQGPLAGALEKAAGAWLEEAQPFVLMTLRGRMYLRMQLDAPGPKAVAQALALFEIAATQALNAAGGTAEPGADSGHSTRSTAWQSFPPDDVPRRR